jgi:hypothetical protein
MKNYIVAGKAYTPKGFTIDDYWTGGVFWSLNRNDAKPLTFSEARRKALESSRYRIEKLEL